MKIDERIENTWSSSGDGMPAEVRESMLRHIHGNMDREYAENRRRAHRLFMGAAACVCALCLGVSSLLFFSSGRNPLPGMSSVFTEKGQKTRMELPDGTIVWLNSASRLSYGNDFGRKCREVQLVGEAYFEVARDERHPFVVNTGLYSVTALGTAFDIAAYPGEDKVVTTLIEGRVLIGCGSTEVLLAPDEIFTCYRKTGKFEKTDSDNAYASALWRENELAVPSGTTLEELAAIIEQNYNIRCHFASDDIRQYRFEGVIKNSQLTNVLELISLSVPVSYRMAGNEIVLYRR